MVKAENALDELRMHAGVSARMNGGRGWSCAGLDRAALLPPRFVGSAPGFLRARARRLGSRGDSALRRGEAGEGDAEERHDAHWR